MAYLGKSNLTSKHNHFQFIAVPQKRLSSYTEERIDSSPFPGAHLNSEVSGISGYWRSRVELWAGS